MGKHRRMGSTCKKFAALGAAAAATTALTIAVVPDSQADKDRDELLRLLADIRPFGTDPQAIPDLTGGLGTTVYDLSEGGASQFLSLATPSANSDSGHPWRQHHHHRAAIRSVELFGIDYGQVPALPSSIADEIEGTPFANREFHRHRELLTATQEALAKAALTPILIAAGCPPTQSRRGHHAILGPIANLAAVRVIPVVGVGLGAFAAGAAYQQVADDFGDRAD